MFNVFCLLCSVPCDTGRLRSNQVFLIGYDKTAIGEVSDVVFQQTVS